MKVANLDQLQSWLKTAEDEHLEFKEAKRGFDFEKLVQLSAAIANEGGGHIILGVTDRVPRKVVGSTAFVDVNRTKAGLSERLHLRIEATTIDHPDGNVTVFSVPSRPVGVPVEYRGAYWMRRGDETVPMTHDMLRRIFNETGPDFSAQVCPGASITDLDSSGIAVLRSLLRQRNYHAARDDTSDAQLLADLELLDNTGVTYAALILVGTQAGLSKHLAQAELVFEYRSDLSSVPYQQREEFRKGFLLYHDDLWNLINLRNETHQYVDGFFSVNIPTFNEVIIREAILNAVSHRDYRLGGSIFLKQYPRQMEVVSPGGFPTGITEDNILDHQAPRNRRISEVLAKCGFVERSGQGLNRMFEHSIREGKLPPSFSGTDDYHVVLNLSGEVQDYRFLRFLERVSQEQSIPFSTHDLRLLDLIHREQRLPTHYRDRLSHLRETGVIESVGRGRGTRYVLSRKFHDFIGEPGTYSRRVGLDKETNKALLLQHVQRAGDEGCPMAELMQVIPYLSRETIKRLMGELRSDGVVELRGRTRNAKWYPKVNSRHPL